MTIKMEMELVSCPICQCPETEPLHQEGPYQMVRCPSCRFIYLNPRPTEQALRRFYQDYLPEDGGSIESWQKSMGPIFRQSARLIKRFQEKGKLLDVGAGFGFFLAEMRAQGWEVEGVDLSEKGMDYGRKTLGLTMHRGPLEVIGFPENGFDVVTAFYLIEHLPHPRVFLNECFRILRPDGLLLLRYPHTTPIKNILKRMDVKNRLYDLPAHLSDFSPGVIQQCLERAGFTQCQHRVGGFTLPRGIGKRVVTVGFGALAETLFLLSGGRLLLPGVSKTILARKGNAV